MSDIYISLSKYEMVHFRDLYNGAGLCRLSADATPEQKRERAITALESVLPREGAREAIGAKDPYPKLRHGDEPRFWLPRGAK